MDTRGDLGCIGAYFLEPHLSRVQWDGKSGVDLWFCEALQCLKKPYIACVPFKEQEDTIAEEEQKILRRDCLSNAKEIWDIRNSQIVEKCDAALVVFDGNKGGTHNVFQQLIEKQKPFIWLNPVGKKRWECI